MNNIEFKTPKLLITDYYDSLVNQIDIYTEKLIESIDVNEIYVRSKNVVVVVVDQESDDDDESEMNICDPYKDPYKEEYTAMIDEIGDSDEMNSLVDYLNSCRMKAIGIIRQVEEDNLKLYDELLDDDVGKELFKIDRGSIDDEKIERLREHLFAKKFCFLLNSPDSPDPFKLNTIVLDFYLNNKRIKLVEEVGSWEDEYESDEDEEEITFEEENDDVDEPDEINDLDYENIFDENDLLAYMVHIYIKSTIKNWPKTTSPIISIEKETLLKIDKISCYILRGYDCIRLDGSSLDLSSIKSLDIGSTRFLKKLDLRGLENLEYLDLKSARIDRSSLKNSNKLIWINTLDCDLSKLGRHWFEKFPSLIFYTNCSPKGYEKGWFRFDLDSLANLKHLHFDNVHLNAERSSFMQTLNNNESLVCLQIIFSQMSFATIETIFKGLNLPNLRKLNLLGSNIENLDFECLSSLNNSLKILNLRSSNIEFIDFGTFNMLGKLESLNLSSNRIRVLKNGAFSSLKSLRKLNLESNQIELIEPDAFKGLDCLEEINLNNNIVSSLDSDILSRLPSLRKTKCSGSNVM